MGELGGRGSCSTLSFQWHPCGQFSTILTPPPVTDWCSWWGGSSLRLQWSLCVSETVIYQHISRPPQPPWKSNSAVFICVESWLGETFLPLPQQQQQTSALYWCKGSGLRSISSLLQQLKVIVSPERGRGKWAGCRAWTGGAADHHLHPCTTLGCLLHPSFPWAPGEGLWQRMCEWLWTLTVSGTPSNSKLTCWSTLDFQNSLNFSWFLLTCFCQAAGRGRRWDRLCPISPPSFGISFTWLHSTLWWTQKNYTFVGFLAFPCC